MCVYGRVLAGRGRDPVQNNGTAVECGAAGEYPESNTRQTLRSEEERFVARLL